MMKVTYVPIFRYGNFPTISYQIKHAMNTTDCSRLIRLVHRCTLETIWRLLFILHFKTRKAGNDIFCVFKHQQFSSAKSGSHILYSNGSSCNNEVPGPPRQFIPSHKYSEKYPTSKLTRNFILI